MLPHECEVDSCLYCRRISVSRIRDGLSDILDKGNFVDEAVGVLKNSAIQLKHVCGDKRRTLPVKNVFDANRRYELVLSALVFINCLLGVHLLSTGDKVCDSSAARATKECQ
jgi:hypothetical protein